MDSGNELDLMQFYLIDFDKKAASFVDCRKSSPVDLYERLDKNRLENFQSTLLPYRPWSREKTAPLLYRTFLRKKTASLIKGTPDSCEYPMLLAK